MPPSSRWHRTGPPRTGDDDSQWVKVATKIEHRSRVSTNSSGHHLTSSCSDPLQPWYTKNLPKVTFAVKREAKREIRLSLDRSDATLAP
jgi:hypothetical protein